ncbi:hypothetical protein [Paraburkholderia caribensis]|uniref:hypothetical protein n=1 Tax=Paraburkholderia caribensis TaxID=75105 RepID=UPI001CB0EF3D|nr:hypothetical protein [Paraburkholderia caribensis]CAG9244920.1 hypothetical protein PCAR4_150225 [Paraburkholderia caribensis]
MGDRRDSEPPESVGFLASVASGIVAVIAVFFMSVLFYPILLLACVIVIIVVKSISPDSSSSEQETPDKHEHAVSSEDIGRPQSDEKIQAPRPVVEPPHAAKAGR